MAIAALAMMTGGCDRGRVDMKGHRLTAAETVAWDTCEAWAESRGLDGPDQNDALVVTKPDGIGIKWAESGWNGGAGAMMGCELDLAGTTFFGVLANDQPVWVPGQK